VELAIGVEPTTA